MQALASLGTALAAFGIAALLAGAWAGLAAAALVGLYPARRGKAWLFAAGGLALGAAVLTRADLLPVPFVLGPLVALWTWRAAGDARRGLVVGGCILGGAVLAIAPWSVYASDRAGEFVPVTRGSASALFVGTYVPGNGTTVGYAGMMLNKVQRMWSRYARGGARHTSPFIRGWHILLVLLSAAGLVAGIARRRSLLLVCILAAALVSTAVHMLVVSQARYNLPLMPALIAGGVAGWAMFLRGHGRRRAETALDSTPVRSSRSRAEKLASVASPG